ncbi:cytochrome B5-like [Aristolochia californica]|uniref:cytochrome B5-like n=1 Tax=Aristolochia californica TaxID=171875 RepID=UPI0035DC264F
MEELKTFSASEVSLHTSKNDCWLIIGGKVYDVTNFLEDHPGGDDVLVEASGKGDATEAFEEVGHSSTAISMMTSYLIGIVDGSSSGKVAKAEEEEVFVPAKTVEAQRAPSFFSNLLQLLVPLLVTGLALGAWYVLNKGSS